MQNQPSTFTENGKATRRDRLYFLDWLRVFAILLVLLVHCSKIFDYHTKVVFNTVRSPVLSAFRDFSLLWIMPLFFVLSGAAVFLFFLFLPISAVAAAFEIFGLGGMRVMGGWDPISYLLFFG
jgi:hypothetical protein